MAANTHPLRTSVPDFVNGLQELERDLITKDRIAEYMAATTLRPEALTSYIWWRDSFYTRNLDLSRRVVRGDDDLLVSGAEDGDSHAQRPVGMDDGGPGRGANARVSRTRACNAPQNQNVVNIDCLGGATELQIEEVPRRWVAQKAAEMVTVISCKTIHQIENAGTRAGV